VAEVIDGRRFRALFLPIKCDEPAPYCGWNLRWLSGAQVGRIVVIVDYDRKEKIVTIGEELQLQAGDRFAVYPRSANWQVHHNTFADCARPMTIDLLGSEGVNINDNIISSSESEG